TVLSLENSQIPPSLHFKNPNPHLRIEETPFYINQHLADWPTTESPRRAAVTALGIGGTNAHVVLEEAQPREVTRRPKPFYLVTASAKSEPASKQVLTNLIEHIRQNPQLDLADVAFTSQLGRQAFAHRRAVVVKDSPESKSALLDDAAKKVI